MDFIDKIFLDKQLYTNNEQQFIDFYYDKQKYPFKNERFKFLIISHDNIHDNKFTKQMIYSFFEGLLENMLCYRYKNYFIIMYYNKEDIEFKEIYNLMIDDFGYMVKMFDGFSINVKKVMDFNKVLNLYFNLNFKNGYYSVADIIIYVSKNNSSEISELRDIIFDKYLNDTQFINIIKGMFDNNLNISKTANAIYMHRNTINNKLDIIKRETGLELQRFKDAVAVYELYK